MNILYVVLPYVLVMYIGIGECNNSTTNISAENANGLCYFCSNCPRPFNPNSVYVTQVPSNTGWCAMMSSASSSDGIFTRGIAPPNLCYSNGCSWKLVNGVNTWVCCCNQNLCNTGVSCYYCSTCPQPFNPYSILVSNVYSPTAWCAKMSTSDSPYAVATRGYAQPDLCYSNGCSMKLINGVSTWVCCCNRDKCNTGVSTSRSTIGMLSAALLMIVMARKSF